MDNLEKIKQASATANKEFRSRVQATGLELADDRGGSVLITGWGNKGMDIPSKLEGAGLEWEVTGRGAYTASAYPLVKRAITQALQKQSLTLG